MNDYNKIIGELLTKQAIKATQYISPKLIIRAVRKRYHRKILKGNIEISLTIGKPNWAEREFVKSCIDAKEPFPIKQIQLKLYNPIIKKLKGRK